METLCAPWPIDAACAFGIDPDEETRPDDQVFAVKLASEILWRFTAGIYGPCPVTVRPCRKSCGQGTPGFFPHLIAGTWVNVVCGCDGADTCSCNTVSKVLLPGPVAEITEVKVDGEILTPEGHYVVQNKNFLVRQGGTWPTCQDMAKDDDQPGTWSVTYKRGRPVPDGGKRAVAELASEFLKACAEDEECQLPARVQTLTREGVAMSLLDDFDYLDKGRTSIGTIDLWLSAVNPDGRRSPSTVWSPDMPEAVVQTWP